MKKEKTWQELLDSKREINICILCGYTNPDAMEKHHISYEPVIIIPLCRNCHRIITKYERGWFVHKDSIDLIDRYHACKELIHLSR